ncbi:uncharacterized protein LY89DRAFT_239201 [Mollisia scopiformis]|uniref:Uncharacterized protein n=1 Tax=Mollisia scopiformis TaxID=149040 RepID=A0A194WUA1_MOLSC|nr:uncharacterized protein LY89DRAFT_239201 [Mollisia scopiformis]KUJ11182.1 hypothetical protein LY89DRAFT_239201 [Mollisia scopiformis]
MANKNRRTAAKYSPGTSKLIIATKPTLRTPREVQQVQSPKLINTEKHYKRLQGANADITVLQTDTNLSQYRITTRSFSDGSTQSQIDHPYQEKGYDFITNMTEITEDARKGCLDARKGCLATRWVEIVVEVEGTGDVNVAILRELEKLRFILKHITKLAIRIKLPALTKFSGQSLASIATSQAYSIVERIVREVDEEMILVDKMNVAGEECCQA